MKRKKIYYKNLFELYSRIKLIMYTVVVFIFALIIDKMEIPSIIYNFGGISLIIALILLIIIIFFKLNLIDLVFVKVVNYFDFCIITLTLSSLLYLINYEFFEYPLNIYKLYILLASIIINIITIIFRCIFIGKNKISEYKPNIIDLKDAYENKLPENENNLYFLDESPVEYDILKRNEIISALYNNIKGCRTDHQYIIGLTGPWGSGKTTILNNVKKLIRESNDMDLVIIDSFDPWIYEDKTAMFRAMFDIFLSKIGLKFSITETNKFIDYLVNIVFDYTNLNKFKTIKNENEEIQRIKKIINNYLVKNNKRIVFIIDNIERANKENIILALKSVFSIFNFDRTIYIISFDKERMKKIFDKNLDIDFEYIEKIIQSEIKIPKISNGQIYDINYKVIRNILNAYGMSINEQDELDKIIKEYSTSIKDLRELKRNINSIINCNYVNNNYLNKIDSFIIKYISLKNYQLFDDIHNNRIRFISEDYSIYSSDYVFNNEKYNKETDEFFRQLFNGENKKYIDLLSICFPNVKLYKDKYTEDKIPDYRQTTGLISYDKSDYYKTNKEKRIYDGKFFDLYFTNTRNEFLEIDIAINKFIKFVNSGNKLKNNINSEYKKLLNLYPDFVQKYTLETLEYYLNDIIKNKYEVLISIYDNIRYCDNTLLFLGGLSSKSRAGVIVADIINKLDSSEFNKLLAYIDNDYKNLYIIRDICHWLNPENNHTRESNGEYYKLFNEKYENLKAKIIRDKIDIYDDDNYGIHNIYCFFDNQKQIEIISKYINKDNIYKFLADMIETSLGNSYEYKIRNDINKVISGDKIEKLIKNTNPKNKKEKFILNVFEQSKNIKTAFDYSYKTDDYYNFDLSK